MPFKFDPPRHPEFGTEPRGTVETLSGCALFSEENGTYDWDGETDVWWDEQRTVEHKDGRVQLSVVARRSVGRSLAALRGHRWRNTMSNNDTMWAGLLAIIRAVILGRRLPPDQLRMFLLFAEPVPYLSAEQIAAAIGRNCGHDIEPELPEGWSQGVSINDPESGDYYDADAQIVGEALMNLLRKEHPEWEHKHWKVTTCDQGWDFLSYRVLDERGRVHPIACWMEGKLNLLRDGEIHDEAARRTVICRFIAGTLEWLWENVGDESETAGLPDDYQEVAAKLHAFFESRCKATSTHTHCSNAARPTSTTAAPGKSTNGSTAGSTHPCFGRRCWISATSRHRATRKRESCSQHK